MSAAGAFVLVLASAVALVSTAQSTVLLPDADHASATCCAVAIRDASRQVVWAAESGASFPIRTFPSCMIAIGPRIEIRIPTESGMIYAPSNLAPGWIVPDDPEESPPIVVESLSGPEAIAHIVLRRNAADAEYRCVEGQDCTCAEAAESRREP